MLKQKIQTHVRRETCSWMILKTDDNESNKLATFSRNGLSFNSRVVANLNLTFLKSVLYTMVFSYREHNSEHSVYYEISCMLSPTRTVATAVKTVYM